MYVSTSGSYFVTRNAQSQLKQNVIGDPIVLASGEKSSAFKVQARGPTPMLRKSID